MQEPTAALVYLEDATICRAGCDFTKCPILQDLFLFSCTLFPSLHVQQGTQRGRSTPRSWLLQRRRPLEAARLWPALRCQHRREAPHAGARHPRGSERRDEVAAEPRWHRPLQADASAWAFFLLLGQQQVTHQMWWLCPDVWNPPWRVSDELTQTWIKVRDPLNPS